MQSERRLEVVLVSLAVLLAAFYARAEYIPTFAEQHIEAAEEKYDLDLGEPNKWFAAWSLGDGQAFAVIAADPTGMKLSTEIKEPAYRFTRAGYGWLAAAASLGQQPWIPYGMAIAGAMAVVGTLGLAISQRPSLGQRTWLLLLNPAIYLGFAGDTAEPLAVLLLGYALATGSKWASAALGVTRPSYLVSLLGRWRQLGWGAGAALLLLVYAFVRFGSEQFILDGGRLDLPLRAFAEHSSVFGWLIAVVAAVTVVVGVRSRDWAWVLAGALTMCLGPDVLANPVNAWRAAGMIPVLWAFGPLYDPVSGLAGAAVGIESVSAEA